ncbi:MAG: LemA family protein [Thermodesulfatator sp.]|nr:MAG: LemA family protein [Thermodesulfatator sp.]
MTTFAVIFIVLGIIVWAIAAYNNLIKLKNLCKEAWSGIDVQLKRRSNLIPNLLETVKGYMKHEKEVFEKVTEARARAMGASSPAERSSAEASLTLGLRGLFAIAENYPELKANQNFLSLQEELSSIEDQIQMARRYYNGTVRNLNTAIEVFPNSVIANIFRFQKEQFFELEDQSQRSVPKVSFK